MNSIFSVFTLVATVMCMLGLSFQFVVFNPLARVFNAIFNETYQNRYNESLPSSVWTTLRSVSSSSIAIGAAIGSICIGRLLMYLSRKNVLLLCNSFLVIGTVITALFGKLTSSYEAVIIGRIVSGLAIGLGFIIIPIILAEVGTRARQSFWLCISGLCIAFGGLVGVVFTHPKVLGSDELWPIAIALGATPNLIHILISWKIPNTLFYVARQGDKDKTMALLKKLRVGTQTELENEYEEILKEMKGRKIIALKEIFKTKQYRMQFINVLCLYASIQFVGITAIVLYSDRIFRLAGIPEDQVSNMTIGLFAARFCGSIFGVKLVGRFGERKVLLVSQSMDIIALAIFTASQAMTHLAPAVLPYVSVSAILLFSVFFSGGTLLSTTSVATAITIEPTRSTIMGFVIVIFWILSYFVGSIPPYLEVMGAYSFTPWIGCSIIFLVYFIMFIPNTKGRSLDEIQAKLNYRRFSSKSFNLSTITKPNQSIPITIA